MWLPPKVRHLVLVNQSPLPSSSPPLLPLLPPLSFLPIYFLYCLFLERNLRVPGITLNWKQTHSSHQNPETKGMSRALFEEREWEREKGKKKKHFWLLIVEECLSKLWSYQAQSAAREGGSSALERWERVILLEKMWGVKMGKESFTFCSNAVVAPLHAALWLLLASRATQFFNPGAPLYQGCMCYDCKPYARCNGSKILRSWQMPFEVFCQQLSWMRICLFHF